MYAILFNELLPNIWDEFVKFYQRLFMQRFFEYIWGYERIKCNCIQYTRTDVTLTQLIVIPTLIVMSLFLFNSFIFKLYSVELFINLILLYILSVFSKWSLLIFHIFQIFYNFSILKTCTGKESADSIQLKFMPFFLISNYLLIMINLSNSIKDFSCNEFLNIFKLREYYINLHAIDGGSRRSHTVQQWTGVRILIYTTPIYIYNSYTFLNIYISYLL